VGLAGGIMTGVGVYQKSSPLLAAGVGFMIAGSILDTGNPGHLEAFNPIPRDKALARELGVTLDDLTDYNENLNSIYEVAQSMTTDLRDLFQRPELKVVLNPEFLAKDTQIELLARKYGFSGAQELIAAFRKEQLSHETLERFSQATQLSPIQAKILLHYGFAVKSS
jgi:hypothetical protein